MQEASENPHILAQYRKDNVLTKLRDLNKRFDILFKGLEE